MNESYSHNFIQDFIRSIVPKGCTSFIVNPTNRSTAFRAKKNQYDYIVLVNILENESDIQGFLETVYKHLHSRGRIIVIYRNYLYSFLQSQNNWLSSTDVKHFLHLSDFEIVFHQPLLFMSRRIPFLSDILNRLILFFFPFNHISMVHYIVARKVDTADHDVPVSIVIPTRNEEGNIARLFSTLPPLGKQTEVIFVEGHSKDNTKNEIINNINRYTNAGPFQFKLIKQTGGFGKAHAVRLGFEKATGEILIIYDADMTVNIEDLRKFYIALIKNKADFINGSRLVYPMERKAMQSLNIFGNKFFSILYSWLLGQPIKDTLCGTKAFWRSDYKRMKRTIDFFGKYDPFGDFDLLLGASKLNLKIIDVPVRYYERTYGSTNIKRFKNAWELARFSYFALFKVKMRLR